MRQQQPMHSSACGISTDTPALAGQFRLHAEHPTGHGPIEEPVHAGPRATTHGSHQGARGDACAGCNCHKPQAWM
eukprot:603545-Lingulodinium_polyedra.AAC.1